MNIRLGPLPKVLFCCSLIAASAMAQVASNRYALILEDPPAASRISPGVESRAAAALPFRQQIEARQQALRTELKSRNIAVTGSVTTLLNAVFVTAPKERLAELQALPGVKGVVPMRVRRLKLNQATQLVNAPAAWALLGGTQNAGVGMKVGLMDTGVDQNHPAFQDSSLPMPAGYPKCNAGYDCAAFTNNKVIVARSYVRQIAAGTNPANPAADSRPDDFTPRDRIGHGTATASCAAGNLNSGAVTFSGMAPKAYIGAYKITGSPQINEGAPDDVILQALDDAFNDGMDVVSFSFGAPAFTGPLDTGAACGQSTGTPCDPVAVAFENAAQKGMPIVVAAGNDGNTAVSSPNFNSIESPGNAPSVITAGGVTNSHQFAITLTVPYSGLAAIPISNANSYIPIYGAITAPIRDVAQVDGGGTACGALSAGSLAGTMALIVHGANNQPCTFDAATANAQSAGAVGVIFSQTGNDPLGDLSANKIPAVLLASTDAATLKTFIAAHPGFSATIDPSAVEQSAVGNELLFFSSLGPVLGSGAIKPDLVAPGYNIYMAAQKYDPLGGLYSATGYISAAGTSFSTPIIAGAAVLVKQNHKAYTGLQVRSALVNSAARTVTTDDSGNPVDVEWLGAGELDTGAAVNATVTSTPATLSFGILKASPVSITLPLQITNNGGSTASLTAAVVASKPSAGAAVQIDKPSFSLPPGASGTLTATLTGTLPTAGSYSGAVTLTGNGVSVRIPYMYLVGDGVPANLFPLSGDSDVAAPGQNIAEGFLSIRLTDRFGVPVANSPVTWTARNGGTLQNADSVTDANGVAAASANVGTQPGTYTFTAATISRQLRYSFTDSARSAPTIGGISDGASFTTTVVPGSYVSIFGAGLADNTMVNSSIILPLALDTASVSFDVPSAGISVPGHLTYASPTQLNVQVPWELAGQSTAQVKVTISYPEVVGYLGNVNGNVVNLALADYVPGFFEIGSGVAAALDTANKVINSTNPAVRGQTVQLFANGLGPVSNPPASGDPALASPLSETTTKPVVTIGGRPAEIIFSGLAPGFSGLYQVNATVPSGIGTGNQALTISIGGKTSKTSGIVVK